MLSDPVMAWNAGNLAGRHRTADVMNWIGIFRNLFAIPNETHSLSAPISLKNDIPSRLVRRCQCRSQ